MSFKRDGDDASLLNCLKKRRVADLLSSVIPCDEASLLKNGRYLCKVCHQGFVFDTLPMLSQHRKGRKHLENLSEFLERKQEFRLLSEERKAKNPNEAKSVTPKTSLLPSKPYDSHCMRKRNKNEPYRKINLNPQSNTKDVPRDEKKSLGNSSSDNAVKSYIRDISRKTSFRDYVEATRAKSNGLVSDSNQSCQIEQKPMTSTNNAKPEDSEEQSRLKEKMSYYAKLRSDGWRKDADGKWVKDEDAEFDTDEETPQDYPQ